MDGRWTPGPNVAPGDPDLCPVIRYAWQSTEDPRTVPNVTGPPPSTISINSIGLITATCPQSPQEIHATPLAASEPSGLTTRDRNKSIRSGAAMGLFINDVSTAKIMILGPGRPCIHLFISVPGPRMDQQHARPTNDGRHILRRPNESYTTAAGKSQPIHTTFNGPSVIVPRFHRTLDCYSMAGKTISGSFLHPSKLDSSMYSLRGWPRGQEDPKVIQVSDLLRCDVLTTYRPSETQLPKIEISRSKIHITRKAHFCIDNGKIGSLR
jgi:hypothetical protein